MTTPSLQPDDLTVENLTSQAIEIGSNIGDERVKFIFSRLIQHSHDFVRETNLRTGEWEAAWQYMTRVCFGSFQENYALMLTYMITGWTVLHA